MKKTRLLLLTALILLMGGIPKSTNAQTSFSADGVWGDRASFTEHDAAKWAVLTIDGNEVYAITTSDVSPIHVSGNAWFDPDGDGENYGGGSGSALGEYAYVGSASMDNFKVTLKSARPWFDNENPNWDIGIIWGLVDDMNYNYVNFGTSPQGSTAAAFVDGEGLRGGPDGLNFTFDMNVVKFQDTLLHEVTLEKVDNRVILKYEGTPVLSLEDNAIDDEGYIGFGSWNDGAYFDDIIVESIDAFEGSTDVSVTTSTGTLNSNAITDIPAGTTVQELLDALTLASGTTAKVVGPDEDNVMLEVAGTELVEGTMSLLVISESGFMMSYYLETGLSDDTSIAAYYTPLQYDEVSGVISTIEGTSLKLFLSAIKPQEGATEAVFDGSTEITDTTAIIEEGMVYRVTAENTVATQDYPIETYEPPYPTYSATQVNDANPIDIDEFFDDWESYGNEIVIEEDLLDDELIAPENAEDLSGTVKYAWDEDFLYVYFKVLDQTTVTTEENSWENDGIELALLMTDDIGKRASYNLFYKAELQPGNHKLLYLPGYTMAQTIENGNNTDAARRDYNGALLASWDLEEGSTGYELEMALPWTALNGIDNPEPFVVEIGNKFTSNVALNDNDGSGRETIRFMELADGNMNMNASEFPLIELVSGIGINNVNAAFSLNLYPNPARTFLRVSNVDNARKVEVHNIAGQIAKKMNLSNDGELNLNVSDLKSGVYLLSITDSTGKIYRGKFVKE